MARLPKILMDGLHISEEKANSLLLRIPSAHRVPEVKESLKLAFWEGRRIGRGGKLGR